MIALLQRVSESSVEVDGERIAAIGAGLLVLACVERDDTGAQAERMAERLVGYRVFGDAEGRLNLSLGETGGGLLLVPQFTLAADTHKGMRPGLGRAAAPGQGRALFEQLVDAARRRHGNVQCGRFGAHLRVGLVNDGPVTFWLESHPA